ncbi:VanW family protein [Faecalibacillus intestinalis]|uniref:VanW family protein n=1 Tax=Faecalibacillus intestinalis TaxID=1982626 RepID=UPI00295EA056|nr:VanW family protein [Faecalibacillus intestinalis]
MKKLNKKIPIMIGAVIGLILVIYICLCFLASGKGFIKNMTINGIKVNNMSKEEVISKLENKYQKDQDQLLLNLEMNGQKYQIDMKDNVKVNIKDQVNDIQKKYNNFFTKGYHYLLQHNENISIDIKNQKQLNKDIKKSGILDYSTLVPTTYKVEKTKVIFTKGKSGEAVKQKDVYNTIQTALNEYDFNKTLKIKPSSVSENESVMKTIYKTLSKEGKNATLDKNNDYKIVAEQYGAKYDLDDSISAFNKAKEGKEFEVKAKAIVPSITKEDLEKNLFKDVLGEYTTSVSGSSVRKNNVRLAGEKCNVILLPGEEFSYNKTVGKRTKENGFGEAGAYLNGETVQEVGGGVCQTSSTLYNAVVLSNLEVTERTNHTYISSYVPIGRDATVSWGGPDFKFKNNRDYPIKIEASYANSKLTCKIIGTNVDGSYVKFTSERTGDVAYNTKYENDATIPEGQQVTKQAGSNGGRAVSYRLVYDKDGKLLSKKKEAKSYYKGHEAIIAVGTMKVEQVPETTPETTPNTEPTQPETTIEPSETTAQ